MCNGNKTLVNGWHPEHNIRESEIGKKLPISDEKVEPFNVGARRTALRENEITER